MTALNLFKKGSRRLLNCEDVNRFIVDYLEETILPDTRDRFEAHLAACPTCGPFFDQYRQTIMLTREEGAIPVDLPPELVEVTLHFLREHYEDRDS